MGQEYHIRRAEMGPKGYTLEFDIPADKYWHIMSPNRWAYRVEPDQMSICIEENGGRIEFSWELGFIHVLFEAGKFSDELAERIMEEIWINIVTETEQEGEFFRTA